MTPLPMREAQRARRSSRGGGCQPWWKREKNAGQVASSRPGGIGVPGRSASSAATSRARACGFAGIAGSARSHNAQP